jgi:hypothetical protein
LLVIGLAGWTLPLLYHGPLDRLSSNLLPQCTEEFLDVRELRSPREPAGINLFSKLLARTGQHSPKSLRDHESILAHFSRSYRASSAAATMPSASSPRIIANFLALQSVSCALRPVRPFPRHLALDQIAGTG